MNFTTQTSSIDACCAFKRKQDSQFWARHYTRSVLTIVLYHQLCKSTQVSIIKEKGRRRGRGKKKRRKEAEKSEDSKIETGKQRKKKINKQTKNSPHATLFPPLRRQ